MVGVLGFEDVRISIHTQLFGGDKRATFALVGRHTKGTWTEAGYR